MEFFITHSVVVKILKQHFQHYLIDNIITQLKHKTQHELYLFVP